MNILEKLRKKPSLIQSKEALVLSEHRATSALRSFFAPKPPAPVNGAQIPLLQKIEQAKRKKNPHGYGEIDRIIRLPISLPLTDKELEAYNKANVMADKYAQGFRLWERQAMSILSYELYGGVFGPVSVGEGKTLITIAIASKAFEKGIQKILLLVPPSVYGQLVKSNLPWIRNHIPVRVPIIMMGGLTPQRRAQLANSKRPGCYILPYSCTSTKDAEDIISAIHPMLIICDEAHRISNRRTARTRRILHYIENVLDKEGKIVEFVALSGTITNKAIMEYHHLIRNALRERCPLPQSPQMASDWGQYIDAKAEEFTGASAGPIQCVVDWAEQHFPEKEITHDVTGFRAAYQLRLRSAPGVVASSENSLGVSLTIQNHEIPVDRSTKEWARLQSLMDQVVDDYLTPNGDQIEHAIHTFKWLFELSAGFYNELKWPSIEQLMQRRSISKDQATEIWEKAQQHHDLKQIFSKELRKWIYSYGKKGLDTPLLVESALGRGAFEEFSEDLVYAWKDKKAAEFDNMPEREGTAIRVHDFKIRAAVDWEVERRARKECKGKGSIIWVYNEEIGLWAAEALTEAGLDPLLCNAGKQSNDALDFERHPENASRTVVASIPAHGEGKNLQHYQHQYMIQWPRPARTAEQLLGRLHRNGQKADEITAETCHTTLFDHLNFAACLNDALYIHQTTGNRQRVIYAGYDPLPMIFPPQVLRERGLQAKMLSVEQQQVMQELFGKSQETNKEN